LRVARFFQCNDSIRRGQLPARATGRRVRRGEDRGNLKPPAAPSSLLGVRGVINNIVVKAPKVAPDKIRKAIEETLERRAEREADRIDVRVLDGGVTLTGRAHSFLEKEAILGTVRHAPGVTSVSDNLHIEPYF
jgi:hypothetical protein